MGSYKLLICYTLVFGQPLSRRFSQQWGFVRDTCICRARDIPLSRSYPQWEDLRSSRGRFAPPAGRWWAGFAPLAPRGRRRGGPREGPVLVECLERPDPHTVGHATPRDGGGFDRLEQFLLRGAVRDGPAHVGGHPILQAPRRQDPQHDQFLHFDGQRAILAYTEAPTSARAAA
jgi:hypothetical protein